MNIVKKKLGNLIDPADRDPGYDNMRQLCNLYGSKNIQKQAEKGVWFKIFPTLSLIDSLLFLTFNGGLIKK